MKDEEAEESNLCCIVYFLSLVFIFIFFLALLKIAFKLLTLFMRSPLVLVIEDKKNQQKAGKNVIIVVRLVL